MLTSTIREKPEVKYNERSLRKIIWLIIHKAILLRTIAKILMISLPYKIDENCNIIDCKTKMSLKPSGKGNNTSEMMKVYSLLKINAQFLYKTIKQKNKARYQGKMLELISKIINTI